MKKIIAILVMVVCLLGTISVANASENGSSKRYYFAVEMLNGNGFGWECKSNSLCSDPGVTYGTSSGMNMRLGLDLFSFLSLEGEWSQLFGFWVKYNGINFMKLKPYSYFVNLKLRPIELFIKKPVLSPYFIYGMGTTNLEMSAPDYTDEKSSYKSSQSTKMGFGIDIPVNKNLYIYSEFSQHNSHFIFSDLIDPNLDMSYSVVSIGAGYKF